MKKYFVILILCCFFGNSFGQTYGLSGRRFTLMAHVGVASNGYDLDTYGFYKPKTDSLNYKRSFLAIPADLQVGYVVTNRISLELGWGMYKQYSPIYVGQSFSYLGRIDHPFRSMYISFGVQINDKKYYAPVSRRQWEIGIIHSRISLVPGGLFQSKITGQFGTAYIGFYQNIFFRKSKSFIATVGVRFGVPIYSLEGNDFINDPSDINNIIEDETFFYLRRRNIFSKVAQIRFGLKYILPFK